MTKITISEYRRLPHDLNGEILPMLGSPRVSYAGTAPSASNAQTAAPTDDTIKFLRLCSDVALHVGYGPTASTADDYYPAGVEILRAIPKGGQLSYIAG